MKQLKQRAMWPDLAKFDNNLQVFGIFEGLHNIWMNKQTNLGVVDSGKETPMSQTKRGRHMKDKL